MKTTTHLNTLLEILSSQTNNKSCWFVSHNTDIRWRFFWPVKRILHHAWTSWSRRLQECHAGIWNSGVTCKHCKFNCYQLWCFSNEVVLVECPEIAGYICFSFRSPFGWLCSLPSQPKCLNMAAAQFVRKPLLSWPANFLFSSIYNSASGLSNWRKGFLKSSHLSLILC